MNAEYSELPFEGQKEKEKKKMKNPSGGDSDSLCESHTLFKA